MDLEIKVPSMGESISEVTVASILKESGSEVEMDEEIIELATDKVNQVIYAPQKGVFRTNLKEDDLVKIGDVIGYIDVKSKNAGQTDEPKAAPAESQTQPTTESAAEPVKPAKTNEAAKPEPQKKGVVEHLQNHGAPAAQINRSDQSPTGQEAVIQKTVQAKEKKPQGASKDMRETRKRMSSIRRLIAARLVEVQHQTAMLTTFNEVDMSAIISLRDLYKDEYTKEHGSRLGFMSFFVKATIAALKKFPALNSYIDGDELVQRLYCSIGVAVGTEKGVIVPVLKDCEEYSFADIEKSIANYAAKVKEGSISPDDLQGAGFTISNGGVYGSLLSTPMLSPNQCGILGMHKIVKRPVVVDDQIAIRPMMYLALSYDHRIADGKEAVSFLIHVKNLIENPSRLLLQL